MKIQKIIDDICAWHEPFEEPKNGNSRDKILAGNSDQECTGIVITVCATMGVLKEAVRQGKNMIISHESIFASLVPGSEDFENNDVVKEKLAYIEENNLCIWRDHDRMHGNGLPFYPVRKRNDYIFYGIMKELGWDDYVTSGKFKPLWYKIPATTGRELAKEIMEKFNLSGLRVVGNLDAKVETVFFAEHVQGRKDEQKVMDAMNADAILPFEICDYTLTQYVNDAAMLGKDKVILEMGHFNFEELGMKYMSEWLKEIVKDEVPIAFVQAGDLFQYIQRS
ncbi:MAG: Nif3-like dinuclear metal center hexameric protein [Erysipelotrichaceae bacterium]|nr:Nif3-like dinuclear metal center hexameric protein [Erysipelotrichaceae bacterium]